MKRRIISISLDCLKDLPAPCRCCYYWESSISDKLKGEEKKKELKEKWFQTTLLDWGECGKILYQASQVLAYAQYGPGFCFPRTANYLAGKVSEDAVFLSCLYVVPEVRGKGLGKIMLRAVEKDLYKRGVKALETIAGKTEKDYVGPMDFYLKNGFFIRREDIQFPLLRIEFKSIVSWSVNLQVALDGIVIPLPAKTPVPS
jgi:GNAT superfamily N-acetyltransferase